MAKQLTRRLAARSPPAGTGLRGSRQSHARAGLLPNSATRTSRNDGNRSKPDAAGPPGARCSGRSCVCAQVARHRLVSRCQYPCILRPNEPAFAGLVRKWREGLLTLIWRWSLIIRYFSSLPRREIIPPPLTPRRQAPQRRWRSPPHRPQGRRRQCKARSRPGTGAAAAKQPTGLRLECRIGR